MQFGKMYLVRLKTESNQSTTKLCKLATALPAGPEGPREGAVSCRKP